MSFLLRNLDFLLKSPDFLLKSPDFLLKNVGFIIKQEARRGGEDHDLSGCDPYWFATVLRLIWVYCEHRQSDGGGRR